METTECQSIGEGDSGSVYCLYMFWKYGVRYGERGQYIRRWCNKRPLVG